MVLVVSVNFAQSGVFYSNEKLKCQFKFTNSITKEDVKEDKLNYKRSSESPIASRLRKNSSLSEYTSQIEEGQSVASSRSSTESFNRFGSVGFKPHKSNSSTFYNRSDSIDTNEEVPYLKENISKVHQSTQSLTHVRNSEDLPNLTIQRNYRPSSVSSWFSSFSNSNVNETALINTVPPLAKKEKLLWGFVQLVGHFVLDENLIQTTAFESLKEKRMYRAANGVGHGGSLGGGTFGYSSSSFINGGNKNSSMADIKKQGESKLFPVYSTPPSVMFCDISLEPGESIVYDYEIVLPGNLPPSYRGKSARFLYYLIMGTQQGEITLEPNVMQLPFRLFNFKDEKGNSPVYNLLEPELIYSDNAIIKSSQDTTKRRGNNLTRLSDQEEFITKALESLNLEQVDDHEGEDEVQFNMLNIESQCLKTVHQLTRRAKSVFYTISKDDTILGKLHLKRTYYRVGDSVNVLIQLLPSPVKTYHVSITLESFENLKEGYSQHPAYRIDQMTRQILAHQQSLIINTDRISLDLTIPLICTPNFETSVVSLGYRLRIEFMVGERSEQLIQSINIDRFRTLNKIQAGSNTESEKLTCLVPIHLLPTNPIYGKAYRSHHTFQLEKIPHP